MTIMLGGDACVQADAVSAARASGPLVRGRATRWMASPRDRWYGDDWRLIWLGWGLAVSLTGWGLQGLVQTPGQELGLDVLKLLVGLLLLAVMVAWVRRPARPRR